jgi:hypothetical protein
MLCDKLKIFTLFFIAKYKTSVTPKIDIDLHLSIYIVINLRSIHLFCILLNRRYCITASSPGANKKISCESLYERFT